MIKFKMVDGKNPEDVRYAVRSSRKLIGYLNLIPHQTAQRISTYNQASIEWITKAVWECEWLDGTKDNTLNPKFEERQRWEAALFLAQHAPQHDPLRVQAQVASTSR